MEEKLEIPKEERCKNQIKGKIKKAILVIAAAFAITYSNKTIYQLFKAREINERTYKVRFHYVKNDVKNEEALRNMLNNAISNFGTVEKLKKCINNGEICHQYFYVNLYTKISGEVKKQSFVESENGNKNAENENKNDINMGLILKYGKLPILNIADLSLDTHMKRKFSLKEAKEKNEIEDKIKEMINTLDNTIATKLKLLENIKEEQLNEVRINVKSETSNVKEERKATEFIIIATAFFALFVSSLFKLPISSEDKKKHKN